jgi:hypothetical protein
MQNVVNAQLLASVVHVNSGIEEYLVMASVCVWITLIDALVHKQMSAKSLCKNSTCINGRILMGS